MERATQVDELKKKLVKSQANLSSLELDLISQTQRADDLLVNLTEAEKENEKEKSEIVKEFEVRNENLQSVITQS